MPVVAICLRYSWKTTDQGLPSTQQDSARLRSGVIAPVGNMRIKESLTDLPAVKQINQIRFTVQDVAERNTDFLEYAQQMGAAGGGATGAGGEAPKLLLRCSANNEIWIDTFQDDDQNPDQYQPSYSIRYRTRPGQPVVVDIKPGI
ncbi:hypothetical protein [Sodalis sp. RH20]|uniref:hypothetical protein n=2 Tax=unclassified Sodalis (in: enterobacteria) TaxID=2636512 RepID=UPI0039B40DBC